MMDGTIISRGDCNLTDSRTIEHIERISVKVSADEAKGQQGLLRNPIKCKGYGYLVTLWVCRDGEGRYGIYDGSDQAVDFFEGCDMLQFPERTCWSAEDAVAAYVERLTILEREDKDTI